MCQNRTIHHPAQRLTACALLLNAVNLTLLIPAARHDHAGWLTHALPGVVTGLIIVLLFLAARQMRGGQQ